MNNEKNNKCLIIAEIAQAHDGSLGTAHAYIDAAAKAGADAIKFQTHIASAESTPSEPWRVKFSLQDETRYDYWKRMEFTEDQWHGLQQHAAELGLDFLSSPFSIEAVDLLSRVGVEAWKVASGETNNYQMLERMTATGLPIILSTGMSTLEEIDRAVEFIKSRHVPVTVLQCTSMYPAPPEKIGLNMIPMLKERYRCDVGLSDHSGTIYAGLAAATLGIDMLEVHITFSREMFGPDVPASITTLELKQLVEGVRFIEKMLENPITKNQIAQDLSEMRNLFTKSIVAKTKLPAGKILKSNHLALKKPGTGLPSDQLEQVIGSRLRVDVEIDEQITQDMLEDLDNGA